MYPALLFETLRKVMAEELADYEHRQAVDGGYGSDIPEPLEKKSPELKSLIMTGKD